MNEKIIKIAYDIYVNDCRKSIGKHMSYEMFHANLKHNNTFRDIVTNGYIELAKNELRKSKIKQLNETR